MTLVTTAWVLVEEIVSIFHRYNIKTKVMAASIRHPLHCVMAAKAGADISTVPFAVFSQMMKHTSDRCRSVSISARLGAGFSMRPVQYNWSEVLSEQARLSLSGPKFTWKR